MAKEKAPAFQFYPKDFLTDERVVLMTNTEIGLYVRLLCFCWLEGTLPLETERLAKMARMPLKQFTKLWEQSIVRECFQVLEDGRLHHKRLDEERSKQTTFHRRQSDRGKAGASARWGAGAAGAMQAPSKSDGRTDASAIGQAMLGDSSSSSSSVSNLQSAKEQKRSSGKRPIYQSDRFAVFEWQLDELSRTLGPHVDDFDLHGFFDDLTQQSRAQGLVIPSDREARWKWLQAQVEREAHRRGLSFAVADDGPVLSKQTQRLMAAMEQLRD